MSRPSFLLKYQLVVHHSIPANTTTSIISCFLEDVDRLRKLKKNSLDVSRSFSGGRVLHFSELSGSDVSELHTGFSICPVSFVKQHCQTQAELILAENVLAETVLARTILVGTIWPKLSGQTILAETIWLTLSGQNYLWLTRSLAETTLG